MSKGGYSCCDYPRLKIPQIPYTDYLQFFFLRRCISDATTKWLVPAFLTNAILQQPHLKIPSIVKFPDRVS